MKRIDIMLLLILLPWRQHPSDASHVLLKLMNKLQLPLSKKLKSVEYNFMGLIGTH